MCSLETWTLKEFGTEVFGELQNGEDKMARDSN
jgi:hypothetical protein